MGTIAYSPKGVWHETTADSKKAQRRYISALAEGQPVSALPRAQLAPENPGRGFEAWTPYLGPYLFLPCLGGLWSMRPPSEIVCNGQKGCLHKFGVHFLGVHNTSCTSLRSMLRSLNFGNSISGFQIRGPYYC